jgi:hypothetical protein
VDFNGDGRFDLFLCHFHMAKNTLYVNYGNLLFSDESRRSRVAATSYNILCFGTVAFDYDRDGAADLFNTTGHVLGPKYSPNEMQPQMLRNDGRGRFEDISSMVESEYFRKKWLGRAVAGGDYDNDGDVDIAINHLKRPAALLRNDTEVGGHFLGLELRTRSRVRPLGARVQVVAGESRSCLPVFAGGSYHASHDPRLLFAIPETTEPPEVTVHWPSGRVDVYNLDVDQYWVIFEGSAPKRHPP